MTGGVRDLFKLANGDPIVGLAIAGGLLVAIYKIFKKAGFFGGMGIIFTAGLINKTGGISKDQIPRVESPTKPTKPIPAASVSEKPSKEG